MKLFLVRHGETQRNREGRVLGQGNQPLTELGKRQVSAVAGAMAGESIAALYTSPLKRAMETAGTIGLALGLQPQPADGLAEVNVGELDGLTSQEMRSRHPEFMARWEQDPGPARMPGGESLADLQDRAWQVVLSILRDHPDEQVVAVSHNFPIETLVCQTLGLPLAGVRRLRVDLASVSIIDLQEGRNRLVRLNDTSHLAGVQPAD